MTEYVGKLVVGLPIRKCAGVRGDKLSGLELRGHKGRELSTASIRMSNV